MTILRKIEDKYPELFKKNYIKEYWKGYLGQPSPNRMNLKDVIQSVNYD